MAFSPLPFPVFQLNVRPMFGIENLVSLLFCSLVNLSAPPTG